MVNEVKIAPIKLEDGSYASVGCNKKLKKHVIDNYTPDLNEIANITLQYKNILNTVEKDRNKCTVSEYATKWLALHVHYERKDMLPNTQAWYAREQLSTEYMNRFNIQKPIAIYENLNDEEPVAIMPAMYLPFSSFKSDDDGLLPLLRLGNARGVDRDTKVVVESKQLCKVIEDKNAELNQVIEKQNVRDRVDDAVYKVLKIFNPKHPYVLEKEMKNQKETAANKDVDVLEEEHISTQKEKLFKDDDITLDFE